MLKVNDTIPHPTKPNEMVTIFDIDVKCPILYHPGEYLTIVTYQTKDGGFGIISATAL